MVDIQFKYGANNVPRIKTPQPLDVEDFAEGYFKLGFHYTNLSHTGFIWGRMVFNNTLIIVYDPEKNRADEEAVDANTIVIDNSLLAEERDINFRSTVMHECGHSVYHPEYFCIDYSEVSCGIDIDVSRLPYTHCKQGDIMGEWGGKKRKLRRHRNSTRHFPKHHKVILPP
jgi:hypothetical protein